MPITSGIATNLGSYIKFKSWQYTFSDLTVATNGTVQTFSLPALGQGSVIMYIRVKHATAFAGGGLTSMKVRVGKTGGTTNWFAGDFDVFQGVADGNLLEVWNPSMGQLSSLTPTVTFTPDSSHPVNAATAGIVAIDFAYLPVTTPTFTGLYTSGQVL